MTYMLFYVYCIVHFIRSKLITYNFDIYVEFFYDYKWNIEVSTDIGNVVVRHYKL